MNIKRCFHKTNYPYYHFSSHVYVPEVDAPQLQVDKHHTYIKYLLDDVTCKKNTSEPTSPWDCLLPDWSEKTNFICNGTCIEHCSLIIEADLIKYLIYAGILICFANIIVFLAERSIKKIMLKKYS